jgi:hypothetical protein
MQSHLEIVCMMKQGLNIIAYAAYCQTDQFGRPIAGYINICPRLLRDPYFNFDKVSKVVLCFSVTHFVSNCYLTTIFIKVCG